MKLGNKEFNNKDKLSLINELSGQIKNKSKIAELLKEAKGIFKKYLK